MNIGRRWLFALTLTTALVASFAPKAQAVSFNCPFNTSAVWKINNQTLTTVHFGQTKAFMANFVSCKIPTPFTWSRSISNVSSSNCKNGTVTFNALATGAAGSWKNAAASSPPFTALATHAPATNTCTWSISVPAAGAVWKDVLQNSTYPNTCTCPTCGQNPPTSGPFNCP